MENENALARAQSNSTIEYDSTTENRFEVFSNPQFGDLTIIINEDGSPWFIGAEVALKLGYLNIHDAFAKHCKRKKLTRDSRLSSSKHFGQRGIVIISESDLYRMMGKSNLPEAEVFQDWVFEDVLSSIRKHGGYIQGQEALSNDELIAKALLVAKSRMDEQALENDRLSHAVEELTHQFAVGITIPAFCKQLNGVNVQGVQNQLVSQGILIKESNSYLPSSRYRNKEFECYSYEYSPGKYRMRPVVTATGATFLYRRYRKGMLPMRQDWNGIYTTSQLTSEHLTALL